MHKKTRKLYKGQVLKIKDCVANSPPFHFIKITDIEYNTHFNFDKFDINFKKIGRDSGLLGCWVFAPEFSEIHNLMFCNKNYV